MYYGQTFNRPLKPHVTHVIVYTRLMSGNRMSSSTILSHIILDLNCLEAGGERHDDYCEAYDYVVECVLLNCASMEEMYNLLEQFDAYSEDYDGDREGYAQAIRDCEYVINSARDDWEEV